MFNKKKKIKDEKPKQPRKSLGFLSRMGLGEERDYFVDNLSMMLASGMSILEAVDAIAVEMKTKQMKKVVAGIKDDIESGSSLTESLRSTKLFSDYALSLIEVGEQSGRLAENLRAVNNQLEKDRVFKSKVRSAMLYPIFVLSFTFLVGIGLSWFVLPKLADTFSRLKIDLPLITRIIINAGNFITDNGLNVIPPIILGIIVILYFLFGFPKTRHIGQIFIFNTSLPVIRRFIQQVQLSRFGFILGSLLESGLPVVKALESLEKSTTFRPYKDFYGYLVKSIESGNSFRLSFSEYKKMKKLMPKPIQQMIISGEQSGRLPESLLKIGLVYEAKMENTTKNLSVIIEPILLIIVGGAVAFVAIGVITPIYNITGGVSEVANPDRVPVVRNSIPEPEVVREEVDNIVVPEVTTNEKLYLEIISPDNNSIEVYDLPDGTVVGQLAPGGNFEVIEQEELWIKIFLPTNDVVWVPTQYVKIK